MRVQSDSVVFAYSGATFVSGGNTYITDFGPNGFHMRFGAGAAAPVPQLDGSLLFSGAQYAYFDGDLTRYYAKMPTAQYTWLAVLRPTALAASIWGCYGESGPNRYGIALGTSAGAPPMRLQALQLIGAGAIPQTVSTRDNTNRGIVYAMTVETTLRGVLDGAVEAEAWIVGAYAPAVYLTTAAVELGRGAVGVWNPFSGTLSYLCLLRGAVSSADMAELSAMMMNATSGTSPWPFCVR